MSGPTRADIVNRFAYHPATPETAQMHDKVRQQCTDLAVALWADLPQTRETALALTAVQEAMMWANASIAIHLSEPATDEQRTTPQPTHGQGDRVGMDLQGADEGYAKVLLNPLEAIEAGKALIDQGERLLAKGGGADV